MNGSMRDQAGTLSPGTSLLIDQDGSVVEGRLATVPALICTCGARTEHGLPTSKALHWRMRLGIEHASMKSPIHEGRIIAPHTPVYTGMRRHVRAC